MHFFEYFLDNIFKFTQISRTSIVSKHKASCGKGDDPSVTKQGNSIGQRAPKQISGWEESTQITPIKNSGDVIVVVDLFDVPVSEKIQM